jgi:hypothetical protein
MNGHHHTGGDHAALHGMLIVGEEKVFLSHLPMFHSPHDFQVLLEVTLRADDSDPFVVYRDDRRSSGEPIYTWVPTPFVLPSLIDAPPGGATMQGTIFRGHFERGGTAITSDQVHADVTRVLFSRKLPAGAAQTPLQYILFGNPAEPFLAHLITRPPDYDHVLAVELLGLTSPWDGNSLLLEIAERQNSPDQRLRAGDEVSGKPLSGSLTNPLQVAVRREFYFETGDLSS